MRPVREERAPVDQRIVGTLHGRQPRRSGPPAETLASMVVLSRCIGERTRGIRPHRLQRAKFAETVKLLWLDGAKGKRAIRRKLDRAPKRDLGSLPGSARHGIALASTHSTNFRSSVALMPKPRDIAALPLRRG